MKRRRVTRGPSPVHSRAISDADEPPIMWPASGAGFEADPYSPAGTAQREYFLIRRLGSSPIGKLFVWAVLVLLVAMLVAALVAAFH
jgi:hypothetical protein